MQGPTTDPKAEKDMAPVLKRDERLLWAGRRSKPGRMTRFFLYAVSVVAIALTIAVLVFGRPWALILIGIYFIPIIVHGVDMWFVTYGITDKRLYFVCRLPRRSWETFNLVDWDTNWIRFGAGRNKIHLAYYGPVDRPGRWNKMQYRRYHGNIENIPDLEAVRGLLLKQIGSAERPVEATKLKRKYRKPPVPGTMTG